MIVIWPFRTLQQTWTLNETINFIVNVPLICTRAFPFRTLHVGPITVTNGEYSPNEVLGPRFPNHLPSLHSMATNGYIRHWPHSLPHPERTNDPRTC